MITSPDNPKLKEVRRLSRRPAREKLGLFTAEGEDLVLAAARAGWVARALFVPGGSPTSMPEELRPIPVEDALLAEHSQLGSSTRALAVYKQRWTEPSGPLALALWGVRDPGNVGTALRSADAFGASCVVLGPESADPYAPKAVRASMGAVFSTPLARAAALGELPGTTVALVAEDAAPIDAVLPELAAAGGAVTLVVGAERDGLPGDVAAAASARATIPMARDSVNAAMAATIALYEYARAQRAQPEGRPGRGS